MAGFTLSLSSEERQCLYDIACARIDRILRCMDEEDRTPPPGVLHEQFGAFVTLKHHGDLRGCIGSLVGNGPLYATVADMAEAAAFRDTRFLPLTLTEFAEITMEISVMGPITRCADPSRVHIGKHGLIMRRGNRQGLLLPQVPVEWGWDRDTFLDQTCRKAGLPSDAWHDPKTEIYWFEAFIV